MRSAGAPYSSRSARSTRDSRRQQQHQGWRGPGALPANGRQRYVTCVLMLTASAARCGGASANPAPGSSGNRAGGTLATLAHGDGSSSWPLWLWVFHGRWWKSCMRCVAGILLARKPAACAPHAPRVPGAADSAGRVTSSQPQRACCSPLLVRALIPCAIVSCAEK